ncbi:MGMT family [Pyrenophora seminiperda CCB06]|uniref:MGMT family n=1 Tax=Pyrenophora seminiperda CCB06 TaxID=1302712 RepID=A0A3M7MBF7_9PLEO|nr:MGMT family [Pyrenophora seminiperda CCB06]
MGQLVVGSEMRNIYVIWLGARYQRRCSASRDLVYWRDGNGRQHHSPNSTFASQPWHPESAQKRFGCGIQPFMRRYRRYLMARSPATATLRCWSENVGVCLKNLPSADADDSNRMGRFHSGNVPWQRVINARGGISPRGPSAAAHQADALRREGVEVRQDAMGLYTVDVGEYGWFPDVLPSEAALVESSDEEDTAEARVP